MYKLPYKFESERLLIPKELDRRIKLTDSERKEIKGLYGKISQRKLAKMFNVSRSLIIYIGRPDRYKIVREQRKLRYYYSKEKHKKAMKNTRKYKKELYNKGGLNEPRTIR